LSLTWSIENISLPEVIDSPCLLAKITQGKRATALKEGDGKASVTCLPEGNYIDFIASLVEMINPIEVVIGLLTTPDFIPN